MKKILNSNTNSVRFIPLILFVFIQCMNGQAQSLPIGFQPYSDYLRRLQLEGQVDSSASFSIQPLTIGQYPGTQHVPDFGKVVNWTDSSKIKLNIRLLPVQLQTQTNSHHPVGVNTGSFFPSKGLQGRLNGGILVEKGHWSLQLMPEVVMAENRTFEEFSTSNFAIYWAFKEMWWDRIDQPIRFGKKPLKQVLPGQSSMRYNFKFLSLGFSTENMWWGPGKRNALLMSNQAPGFLHLTFNTVKPIKTGVGNFEGQVIAGKLDNSGFGYPKSGVPIIDININQTREPKKDSWRYLSGFTFSYQPKWIPGLFFGFSRTAQLYHDALNDFRDFIPFSHDKILDNIDIDLKPGHQQIFSSLSFRWLLVDSRAEFYGEYGIQGGLNTLNLMELANNHRSFTFGLSKLFPLGTGDGIQVELETTHLGQVSRPIIWKQQSWYTDGMIRQGYTHKGRLLGAAIGPGSNNEFLQLSYYSGRNKFGVFVERYLHNNDYFYYAFSWPYPDTRGHWVDLNLGAFGNYRFKKFFISATLQWTKSFNYQWVQYQVPGIPFSPGSDTKNLNTQFSLAYLF